jgi:glycosyltransferase involved in cell wall biosynthesis
LGANPKEVAQVTFTLVTATLPSRANLLTEMLTSVSQQTVPPANHIVMRDDGRGFVETVNRAVSLVDTDYFCLVDDDDLLLPNHVETLTKAITESSDIVWTWTDVQGRDWNPNQGYEPGKLQRENYIPSNMVMRTSLWREMGGYRKEPRHPDWDMLQRCESAGADFYNVPDVTWVYRFHGGNTSV